MAGFVDSIRRGAWLTPQRARAYAVLLLAAGAVALAAGMLADGLGHGVAGRQPGTDFTQVWVAGLEANEGAASAPFDPATHFARQRALFGANAHIYGWHYPPFFLFIAAALALLPYLAALAVWLGATLAAYLAAFRAAVGAPPPAGWWLPALAFPAVFVNIGHGQNGFLTAALLAGGLMLVDRRPFLAGAILACLAYKPQFALIAPLALLAAREGRALAGGAAGLAALCLVTLAAFGLAPWLAFLRSLDFTQRVVIEGGAIGFEKIQSVFAAARLLGASTTAAYAAQAIVAAAAFAGVVRLWAAGADRRLAIAAALTAALMTTPYCLDYDMVVLGPALALMYAHGRARGFAPYEKSAMALVFVTPLIARPLAGLSAPVAPLIVCMFFGFIVWRASASQPAASPAAA